MSWWNEQVVPRATDVLLGNENGVPARSFSVNVPPCVEFIAKLCPFSPSGRCGGRNT